MGKETGGPAFPLTRESSFSKNYEGMTLRDYLAAQVMTGVMASGTSLSIGKNHHDGMLDMAVAFYSMADAMLEARGK